MSAYLVTAIEDFSDNEKLKPVAMPARLGLFMIDKNTKKVSKKNGNYFIVLFISCCMYYYVKEGTFS
jgi:hypothetical protein